MVCVAPSSTSRRPRRSRKPLRTTHSRKGRDSQEAELERDGYRLQRIHATSKSISVSPSSTRSPSRSGRAGRPRDCRSRARHWWSADLRSSSPPVRATAWRGAGIPRCHRGRCRSCGCGRSPRPSVRPASASVDVDEGSPGAAGTCLLAQVLAAAETAVDHRFTVLGLSRFPDLVFGGPHQPRLDPELPEPHSSSV